MPLLNKREITKIEAHEDQKGRLPIRLPNALSSHLSARPVRPADALLTVEKGCSASHGFVERANLPDARRTVPRIGGWPNRCMRDTFAGR